MCVIRDDPAEARRVLRGLFERSGEADPWETEIVGTPEQVAHAIEPYLGIGFRHFIAGFPAPYDVESMERLITELRPKLERR